MPSPHSPNQNHLLAALPTAEFERLAAHLELVPLRLGEILYEPGGQMQHAYFPTTAIVSLHYVMESGASAETAGVGNEGVVGISLFMGGDTTPSSAVVQTAGHAYRLAGRLLKQEFNRGGLMQGLLLRYTQALITQMIQTAACNRHHSVEQQLCRWLLLTLDRIPVGRAGHDAGTGRQHARRAPRGHHARPPGDLQRAGLISYRRGHISVLERTGLEDARLRMLRRGQEGTGPPAVRRAATARASSPRACQTGRSDRTSPADHPEQDDHDRDHQQDVDEAAHGEGRNEAQRPQDEKHDSNGVEHGGSPLVARSILRQSDRPFRAPADTMSAENIPQSCVRCRADWRAPSILAASDRTAFFRLCRQSNCTQHRSKGGTKSERRKRET